MNSRRFTASASRASNRKDSTPPHRGRLLRCGISTRPMSLVGHSRPRRTKPHHSPCPLHPESGHLDSLPPPALGKCRHRGLARLRIAVRRRAILVVAECERPKPGRSYRRRVGLEDAAHDNPSVSTSKSSSFHSLDGRVAEARFRINACRTSFAICGSGAVFEISVGVHEQRPKIGHRFNL
jgi:hypothetical protein